jgi:hypothetical protein
MIVGDESIGKGDMSASMHPESLLEMEQYARMIHKDDTRWGGEDYFENHCKRMADKFSGYYRKAVCYLHDTEEDHPEQKCLETIYERFGPIIAGYVEIVTHRPSESYANYIRRIAESMCRVAIEVKIADLNDNLSDLYNSSNPEKNKQRKDKYELARLYLEKALETADIT